MYASDASDIQTDRQTDIHKPLEFKCSALISVHALSRTRGLDRCLPLRGRLLAPPVPLRAQGSWPSLKVGEALDSSRRSRKRSWRRALSQNNNFAFVTKILGSVSGEKKVRRRISGKRYHHTNFTGPMRPAKQISPSLRKVVSSTGTKTQEQCVHSGEQASQATRHPNRSTGNPKTRLCAATHETTGLGTEDFPRRYC